MEILARGHPINNTFSVLHSVHIVSTVDMSLYHNDSSELSLMGPGSYSISVHMGTRVYIADTDRNMASGCLWCPYIGCIYLVLYASWQTSWI